MATQFAVDSNFLMDCAHPKDDALDALDVIRQRVPYARIVLTPTAFSELVHHAMDDSSLAKRKLANAALRQIRARGVALVELGEMQTITAKRVARRLLEEEIIPPKERNDAHIVGEAAVLECPMLISSDWHVRDADRERMERVLRECGVPMVAVRKPWEIVRKFDER